ncbi:MAG: hypothetical protein ACP5Q4_08760, partial [Candidatus Caldatribacteriaceae bacterium]
EPARALLWRERLRSVPIRLIESLQAMRHNSLLYLQELLEKYSCKDGNTEQIERTAQVLNTHSRHSFHGRGISLKQAQEELVLKVKNLKEEPELEDKVLSVYHAGIILFQKTPVYKIISNHLDRRYIMQFVPSLAKS